MIIICEHEVEDLNHVQMKVQFTFGSQSDSFSHVQKLNQGNSSMKSPHVLLNSTEEVDYSIRRQH